MDSPRRNHLIAALNDEQYAALSPFMELVRLPVGKVICEIGGRIVHLHFPIDAIISLMSVLEDGSGAEIAIIGREGVFGVASYMGGDNAPYRAIVQSEGLAVRIPTHAILREFQHDCSLRILLLRYALALIGQMAHAAVCNRHHTVEQQVCRWILAMLDRMDGDELVITQQLIADMLGVRREGVTDAARKLQKAGLMTYHRGHIRVLSRQKMEAHACECYAAAKQDYERTLRHAGSVLNGHAAFGYTPPRPILMPEALRGFSRPSPN
jgi:CRP-like cAMP-binding protein